MAYSGFEAAPADFAAAAPRFEKAADELATALERAVDELEGHGSFWGHDEEFGREYVADWHETTDLAFACEKALRAMAGQLAGSSAAYAAADEACAESFSSLHDRLAAILDPDGVRR
jgi:uncharacterized protein YukE